MNDTRWTDQFQQRLPLADAPTSWLPPGLAREDATNWAKFQLEQLGATLMEAQLRLFANQHNSVVVVVQGMDTSGKDGLIRRLFTHLNPVGLHAHSFAAPTAAESRHHFLWRTINALPARGHIAVFNRSYYEEIMYLAVHPQMHADTDIVATRIRQIKRFEADLHAGGVQIVKIFLHISKHEQGLRLLRRANDPQRSWKLQQADLLDRKLWHEHQAAFEFAMQQTSTVGLPWYVVPADDKWMASYLVGELVLACLSSIAPAYPQVTPDKAELCEQVRAAISAEESI